MYFLAPRATCGWASSSAREQDEATSEAITAQVSHRYIRGSQPVAGAVSEPTPGPAFPVLLLCRRLRNS